MHVRLAIKVKFTRFISSSCWCRAVYYLSLVIVCCVCISRGIVTSYDRIIWFWFPLLHVSQRRQRRSCMAELALDQPVTYFCVFDVYLRADGRCVLFLATEGVYSTFLCQKHTICHFVHKNVLREEPPVSSVAILGFGRYASTKITTLRKITCCHRGNY